MNEHFNNSIKKRMNSVHLDYNKKINRIERNAEIGMMQNIFVTES